MALYGHTYVVRLDYKDILLNSWCLGNRFKNFIISKLIKITQYLIEARGGRGH